MISSDSEEKERRKCDSQYWIFSVMQGDTFKNFVVVVNKFRQLLTKKLIMNC